ncbi:ABC transporter permease [Roseivirga sp. E12]|uniref:ABC transporter permease n=1 Tax=Roseivirga sp. E12 TaxID=2819237 RepID=UPI001ABD1069|nr:ABC transporter permease [Roseivirga sp. E12]MBO3699155.1 ABC transporter permease [Roseivirga sp. E12]
MLIKNYFKIGMRFLWKTRGYSSLNILGLALGIAICWLAYIFVSDENSFDGFYANGDHIYRPTATMSSGDRTDRFAGSSYIMGEEFPSQIPEIIKSSRFKNASTLVKVKDAFQQESFHYADRDFFEMFSVDFIIGNPGDFIDPLSIVVSETTADRLGIEKASGQQEITISSGEEDQTLKVVGIYKDFPLNTSVRPQIIFPFSSWASENERRTKVWFDINMNSFFQIDPNSSAEVVEQKMNDVFPEDPELEEVEVRLGLQPLTDMHLNPEFGTGNGIAARGDNQLITIVTIIGIFCLLIACVNYANFAVGNYIIRLKEVALRKVFGAEKTSVFKQFVAEAFISAFLAFVLSIIFMALMLPGFAEYADKTYTLDIIFNSEVLFGGLLILVVVTLLSGIYPALLLSRYKTINGLKGKSKLGGRNYLAKGLITLQFAISAFLIAGMLTMNGQLSFLLNHDLGYSGEKVVRVFRPITDTQTKESFKNDLLAISGVEDVTIASGFNGTNYKDQNDVRVDVRHARIDPDYIKTMGIELVAGRSFDKEISTDITGAVIVNEAFIEKTKLENPIGKQIYFNYGEFQKPTIVGVVKNFNFESLRSGVDPLVMWMGDRLLTYNTYIKFSGVNQDKIAEIEAIHDRYFSPYPFSYRFVEDDIANRYALEASIRKIAQVGSAAAIFLSCLGLMGFVGNQIRQQMKDVSVRKVVGASGKQIFGLYLSKYIWLLLIGTVVGLAIAISVMTDWLNNYTYKIDFGWTIGATAVIAVLSVAVLTVFSQLYRALKANPITYLKEE